MLKKATLRYHNGMRFVGTNESGIETTFDTTQEHGGANTAASPMEVLLQATAACSAMDVVDIVRKRRKTITDLQIEMHGTRAETHPKVYTAMHFTYILTSPDAQESDLERAVELSQTQYCSAAAMMRQSGCTVTWECRIIRP